MHEAYPYPGICPSNPPRTNAAFTPFHAVAPFVGILGQCICSVPRSSHLLTCNQAVGSVHASVKLRLGCCAFAAVCLSSLLCSSPPPLFQLCMAQPPPRQHTQQFAPSNCKLPHQRWSIRKPQGTVTPPGLSDLTCCASSIGAFGPATPMLPKNGSVIYGSPRGVSFLPGAAVLPLPLLLLPRSITASTLARPILQPPPGPVRWQCRQCRVASHAALPVPLRRLPRRLCITAPPAAAVQGAACSALRRTARWQLRHRASRALEDGLLRARAGACLLGGASPLWRGPRRLRLQSDA